MTIPIFSMPSVAADFSENAHIVLHNGDSLEFVRTIPSKIIRLIITSPPYNLGKEYETRTSIEEYLATQEQVIDELLRTLAEDGSLCWQVGNYVSNSEVFPLDMFYYHIFKRKGLKLRNRVIWHFDHGLHASKRFSGRYETLLWFTRGDDYVFNLDAVRVPAKYPGKTFYKGPLRGKPSGNPLGKNPSDFWRFLADEMEQGIWEIPNVKANHPEKTAHQCQFPIELVERCVLAFTKEGDWVLDPYCGVGSALIAAIKRGRKAAGVDKEANYTTIAKERIEKYYNGSLKIRPLGKPVHKPTGREKVSQVPIEWESRDVHPGRD